MEQWYAVIDKSTGEAYSFGTIIANPVPEHLEAVPIDGPPGDRMWDVQAKTLRKPPPPKGDFGAPLGV